MARETISRYADFVTVVLFPLRAEARPFLKKLSVFAAPSGSRRGRFASFDFEFESRPISVIITGAGRSLLALPEAGLIPAGADLVLAGVAKALNPRFNVGDIFAVTSVKREGQAGMLSLPPPRLRSLPTASLLTCDRVVFRSDETADLADMEGYYAATVFPGLTIVRAVSDRDENLEFLNRCRPGGRFRPGVFIRNLTPRRAADLVRFRRNIGRASRKLADVLWDFVSGSSADLRASAEPN